MPSTDPVDQHLFNSVQKRHQRKIRDLAEHIREYSLYLLNDAQAGQYRLGEQYAQTIEKDIAEIRRRIAVLDALDEVAPIVADPPAAETVEEPPCCDDESPHYHCGSCGEIVSMMGHLMPGGRIICDRQERRAYLRSLAAAAEDAPST